MRFKMNVKLEKGRLDLAPLIDVVLLLLLFFMLSSSFVFQPGINVDLPESAASEPQKKEKVVVTITKEDIMYVNNFRTTMEGIVRHLQKECSRNPQLTLIIRADNSVRHGKVVRIMSAARKVGINAISIATKAKHS